MTVSLVNSQTCDCLFLGTQKWTRVLRSLVYAEKFWGYLYYKIKTLLKKCQTEEIQGILTFPSAFLAISLFIPQCETFRICLGNVESKGQVLSPSFPALMHSGAWPKFAFDLGTMMVSNMSVDLICVLELGVLWAQYEHLVLSYLATRANETS